MQACAKTAHCVPAPRNRTDAIASAHRRNIARASDPAKHRLKPVTALAKHVAKAIETQKTLPERQGFFMLGRGADRRARLTFCRFVLYYSCIIIRAREKRAKEKGMRALVIEDDKPLSDMLCKMLEGTAHADAAYDGESGLNKLLTQDYDIVILDIMLPRMNGEEVLRNLRKHKTTPVIILSAIGMLERKVEFLNIGADDYMTKPFSREELLARVHATMRRYNRDFGQMRYKFGDFELNYSSKMVTWKGEMLPINGKLYDVLETLVKNKEIIVTLYSPISVNPCAGS